MQTNQISKPQQAAALSFQQCLESGHRSSARCGPGYYSVREIEFVILVTARWCFAKHRATCLCVLFCACRAHVSHAWAHHHRQIMKTTTRPFWTEREILKHECDQFKSTLKVPALDAAAGEGVPLVEKKTGDKAGGRRFESLLA